MDEPAPPLPSPPSSCGGIFAACAAALVVVAVGVTVPLQVTTLKKDKAEATVLPPEVHVHRPPEYGVASWYGSHWAGRPTASGVVFKPEALTAAHRWLPLGTKVRVTRLSTRHSVVVTINDRGPYIGGRIIDLSKGAAQELAMVDQGLAEVRIDVISEPSPAVQMVKRAIRKAHKPPPEQMAEQPAKHKPVAAKAKEQHEARPVEEAEAPAVNPVDTQPADTNPVNAKPVKVKPVDATAVDPRPLEVKPATLEPDSNQHFP